MKVHRVPRDRHQSLYFDYQEYPFVRPVEMDGDTSPHQVAIVGAGPVGLTLGLVLAKHGVEAVVLEKDCMVSEGSRAICIARRSLEILHPLGIAETLNAKALPWTAGRSFYRGRQIYRLKMPDSDDERYAPMVNIQQNYVEKFLVDGCQKEDLISLRWRSEVVGLKQHSDHVRIRVRTPEGDYELSALYAVAADGARSSIRDLLGLHLAGESYEGRYLIADIKLRSDYPTERRAWFDPSSNPGSTALMHKQPDDIWRVDFQLVGAEAALDEIPEEQVRRRIQKHLEMCGEKGPWELDWYSIYRAHCLCLDSYVHERVIFAGDAAHLVPIFGVRGLNSGFADAGNLGWKLAYVLKGWSRRDLLETYSDERRAATLDTFREAGKSTQFMTPQTRGYHLLRDATLSLALTEDAFRELANPRQTQPYDYIESPLNTHDDDSDRFDSGPHNGAPARNVRIANQKFLLDFLGRDFTALYFCTPDSGVNAFLAEATDCCVGDRALSVVTIATAGDETSGDVIVDAAQRVFSAYGATPGTVYLIRPDGHVCGRWLKANARKIQLALDTAAMAGGRADVYDRRGG